MLRARTIARWGGVTAALLAACALLGGAHAHGVSAQTAPPTSQTLQPLPGGAAQGTGLALPNGDGSYTIVLNGATPQATYEVSSCQTNPGLLSSMCQSNGTSSQITTDGSGHAAASVTLPALPELDTIQVQNVASATDIYYALIGPNPPSFQAGAPATTQAATIAVLVNGQVVQVSGSSLLMQLLLGQAGLAPYIQLINGVPVYVIPSALAPAGTCGSGFTGTVQLAITLPGLNPLYPILVTCP